MLIKMGKSSGVSMAQTLLVMGIVFLVLFFIAVIPLYNAYKKKKAVTKLKVTYTELVQANRYYSMANSDVMGNFDTSLPIDKFVEKYFLPYLSIESSCKDDQKACWNEVTYKDLANNKISMDIPYTVELKDNAIVGFTKNDKGLINLIIDLDNRAGENKLGRDVYIMSIYSNFTPKICDASSYEGKSMINDGLHFGGFDECGIPQDEYDYLELSNKDFVDGCNKKSQKSLNGTGVGSACSALIKAANWAIDKSYPW